MLVETISPRDLKTKLDSGCPLVLLDVREDEERNLCVIAATGAVVNLHIPMSHMLLRIGEVLEHQTPIVVYCHHGVRSMVMARWLAERGVAKLSNLDGGIDAWSRQIDGSVRRY